MAQEEIVEPKIQNLQPEEKPLGETLKDLFSKPVLPEMTDVHLPLNLNIEAFKGEQLRLTGDTDHGLYMLLKVSSIDGQHEARRAGYRHQPVALSMPRVMPRCVTTGRWILPWNSALNIDPLKGEKVKVKVGGGATRQADVGGESLRPGGHGSARANPAGSRTAT